MRSIINILKFLFLIILLIKPLSASITDDLLKLSKMYDDGTLTSEEFSKAKKILLQLDEIESVEIKKSESIRFQQLLKIEISRYLSKTFIYIDYVNIITIITQSEQNPIIIAIFY